MASNMDMYRSIRHPKDPMTPPENKSFVHALN